MERERTSRRNVLRYAGAVAAASMCGGCAGTGARPDAVAEPQQGVIRLSPDQSAKLIASPGSLLIDAGKAGKILVVHSGDAGIHALSATCTHLGCVVGFDVEAGRIQCPCHGSQYGLDGQNIKGPAKRPLKAYKARIENGHVVVTL